MDVDALCNLDENGNRLMSKFDAPDSWEDGYNRNLKSMFYAWVACPNCKNHVTVESEQDSKRNHNEHDCEMCGSHGDYVLDVVCPHCETKLEIIVGEW